MYQHKSYSVNIYMEDVNNQGNWVKGVLNFLQYLCNFFLNLKLFLQPKVIFLRKSECITFLLKTRVINHPGLPNMEVSWDARCFLLKPRKTLSKPGWSVTLNPQMAPHLIG